MHRNITYRLIPGSRLRADRISQTAGACRWVWNRILADTQDDYRLHCDTERICEDTLFGLLIERPSKPSLTFFSLGKRFTELRRQTPWLKELSFACVRHVLKYQAEAWKRAFDDPNTGFPHFKARQGDDSFTIPHDVKMRIDAVSGITRLWVPKVGWCVLRRSGGNPYRGCKPVQAVIKRVVGRWYCTVCYDAGEIMIPDNGLAVGIDRNCGQVATSEGVIHPMPDVSRFEARRRRYQRMMDRRVKGSRRRAVARHRCAKAQRSIAMVRAHWQHHISRVLADGYGTVVIEALDTKGMTATARGTPENPGSNVKAKARLNRSILATGWRGLRDKLDYKAANLIEVDPAHTSQRCARCGHTEAANRLSQSRFECVACGHQGNADINAALNILTRGAGVAGRGGVLASATPMSRQRDMPNLAALPTC